MEKGRWKEIEELFEAVVDLAPDDRERFFKENSHDPDLVAEVRKLIDDSDAAGDFIESPAWTDSQMLGKTERGRIGASLDDEIRRGDGSLIGQRLGVYKLTKELGRGGMGAVYLAERDDGEFRQRVALKVIKRGMDTDFIVRRFRNERQILATLDHPNIARLLDGGTTDDGLPFFVMEFIEGRPVYRYCDAERLSVAQRLELFRKICFAVDYAHQNLIIHRDIKPSNILVAPDGTAKLLDFGIAKILNPELASDSIDPTATSMRMMTPEYASPEQVRGEAVTIASDIYSLGVLLYELLTGHRPYRLKNRALHEIARVICEEEPDSLGSSLTRDDNLVPTSDSEKITADEIFENRGSDLESLRRELAGDLERIVFKAMRKNPLERYKSAADFAQDILHFLEKRPVMAEDFFASSIRIPRPITRDPEGELSIAVLPLKLLGGGVREDTGDEFLGIGLADALITRLSNIRRIVVRPTSSVLQFADVGTDPFAAGRELGVDFILDGNIRRAGDRLRVTLQFLSVAENAARWAESFDERFLDVLEIEDSISERVVKSLVPQLTGEEELQLHKRGTNSPEAYEAYLKGRFYWNRFTPDYLAKAQLEFERAIELDPDYPLALVGLADSYLWGCIYGLRPSLEALASAEKLSRRAMELDENLGEAYASLALVAQNRGQWAEAESLHLTAQRLSPNYPQTYEWCSALLIGIGRTEEGVRQSRIANKLDLLSPRTKTLHAWAMYQAHRFSEALDLAREIFDLDPGYPQAYLQSAVNLLAIGEREEGLDRLRQFNEMIPNSAMAKYMLTFALVENGLPEDAKTCVDEIESMAELVYVKPYFLGMAYLAIGRIDEAFEKFNQAAQENDPWMVWFATEPMLRVIRSDSRYFEILRRMNNPVAVGEPSLEASDTGSKTSIAVLPLKILHTGTAGDSHEEFLGIGLADALINRLSGVRRLIVRPTSSVIRFEGQTDPFAAASQLEVGYVVDGSLRRAGNRIRVSIQLLSASERTTVWAKSFDEDLTDVLALEDSISKQIAEALVVKLTGNSHDRVASRGTNNAEAYEAYLRGRFHWHQYTADGLAKSLVAFYEAIALDPNFAPAYAGVADYYNFLSIFGIMSPAETFPAAKEAALKAVELDDSLAEAYTSLAVIALGYEWDFDAAENYLKRAIELNPNLSEAYNWFGQLYTVLGKHDRAIKSMEKAERLNPQSASLSVAHTIILRNARRTDEAIAKLRRAIALHPNNPTALAGFGWFIRDIDPQEAIANCRKAVELSQRQSLPVYALSYSLAVVGKTKEARDLLDELDERRQKQYVPPIYNSLIYVELGDREAAFEWLERAFDEHDYWAAYARVEPRFDPIRDDPRFIALAERLGPVPDDEIHQSQVATKILSVETRDPKTVETAEVTREVGGQRRPLWIVVGAAIALAFVLIDWGAYRAIYPTTDLVVVNRPNLSKEPAGVKTIAVLPFKTDMHTPDEQGLGLGLAESIHRKLGQARGLSVRAALLNMPDEQSPARLGEIFGVAYVLRGTLHESGEKVEVSAELVDTKSENVIWTKTFDEKLTDFPTLQVSIADQVLSALTVQLTSDERQQIDKTYTENSEAYQLYLAGRYLMSNRSAENLRKAINTFEKARDADPNFALAYAGLADAWSLLNLYQVPPPDEAYGIGKQNAYKALELDPNLAEAHASLGYILLYGEYRRSEAVKELEKATELNPSYATAHHWLALAYTSMGRFDAAIASINKAMDIERRSAIVHTAAALIYNYAGQPDEALKFARQALELNPGLVPVHKSMRIIYESMGNYEGARSAYDKERLYAGGDNENDPGWLMITAQVQAVGGKREEAMASLKKAEAAPIVKNNARAYADEMAIAYAMLGDADNAVRWLARAREVRSYSLNFAAVEPRYAKIKNDPRFVELTRLESQNRER